MANTNLHAAKRNKNDEFYTRREDIEAELQHYNEHFRGKVVYCNCDDPAESEFVRYFCRVFRPLGLKRLIATHYDYDEQNWTYSLEIDADDDRLPEVITPDCMTRTPLPCNGDFRSASCVELLKQADIVVTNPPFSLFREYVAQLMEYGKKFIIMGNKNAITYKEFFPYLMHDEIWVGETSLNGGRWMIIPDHIEVQSKKMRLTDDGHRIVNVAGVCWFTNLSIPKRERKIDMTGNYYSPEVYPTYDNYDAIEVKNVVDIPIDYEPGYLVPVGYRPQLEAQGFILGHERDNAQGIRCVCVCGRRHDVAGHSDGCDGVVQRCDGRTDNIHGQVQSGTVRDGGNERQWRCERYVQEGTFQEAQRAISGWKEDLQAALYTQEDFEYCSGVMGVPITFMDKYCPEQFEIVNANDYRRSKDVKEKPHGLIKDKEASITERERERVRTTYARICIRRAGVTGR